MHSTVIISDSRVSRFIFVNLVQHVYYFHIWSCTDESIGDENNMSVVV